MICFDGFNPGSLVRGVNCLRCLLCLSFFLCFFFFFFFITWPLPCVCLVLLFCPSCFHPLFLPPWEGMECVLSLHATLTLSPIFLSFKARADNCDFSSPGAKEIAPCKCLHIQARTPQGCFSACQLNVL